MKKTIRSLQAGRSMIEVIAILAVMGILLIAGLVGFKLLLDYLKQKETIEQVTTIGMRYKASRLNAKTPQQGYVPMKQVYPEGKNCNSNPECVITPEGGQVKLYSMGESKNFVVLVSQLKSTSCQELAMMGGYEFVFKPKQNLDKTTTPPTLNEYPQPTVFEEISEIIKENDERTTDVFTFTNEGNFTVQGKETETIALTPEYIKKNPTVLKKFCDPNIPLLGFMYSADEDCDYFYDGACHDCSSGQVQDSTGECCNKGDLEKPENCGLCHGCGTTKKCLEDEQRCVECIENSDCPDGKFCSNNKCVTCEGPFYKLTDGECTCVGPEELLPTYTGEIGSECKEACNCKAGLICIEGKCAECVIQPDCPGNVPCVLGKCKCDADNPCPTGQVCCEGTCCPAGQFCNDGVCSNCTSDTQCGGTRKCCVDVCCAEGAICCNDQCCDKRCITVDGQETCGGCEDDSDCPDNEYCDTTEGICKPCLNEYTKTCGDSVMETFNKKCYEKKHLNCLDATGTKTQAQLIQDTPNTKEPVCRDDENDSNATCDACTSTAQCQALENNGDTGRKRLNEDMDTKVDNALFKDFVCRTQGDNKGTCGPCEVNADCKGVPCFDGVCGCKTNTDCAGNMDGTKCLTTHSCGCLSDADCQTPEHLRTGQTKCNIANGVGTCDCDDGLDFDETLGYCVCSTANEFWTRYTDNTATDQKYLCCPNGQVATMAGTEPICVPMCEGNEHVSVAMMLDYSWSGNIVDLRGTKFNSARTNLANAFINGLKQINSDILFGVFREDNNHETNTNSPQKCQGSKNNETIQDFSEGTGTPDLNQDLCSYSEEKGLTAFTKAINEIKNECNSNKEKTIVFVLSDGMIPTNTATATGCKTNNMYVYAAGEKSFGLPTGHEAQFTATPTPEILLNMVADKICVNPEQMTGASQPGYDPKNP